MTWLRDDTCQVSLLTGLQAFTIFTSPLLQPTHVLEDFIDRIEAGTDSRIVMDLGCGSGREVCFLALRGWNVFAVDNMPKQMSKKFGTSGQIRTECLDVKRQISRMPVLLGTHGVDLLLVVGFFHCAKLPRLMALVKPGGFVLFSQFRDGVVYHLVRHPSSVDDFLEIGDLQELLASGS